MLTVADSGSVSSAAASLGVSQPALSAQLARIENAFGGTLFARSSSGVQPTAVGELVIERARELVRGLEGLLVDIHRHCADVAVLRVATNTPRYFSTLLLELSRVGLSRDVVPRVNVSSEVITGDLLRGEVDVAVVGVHRGHDDECPPGLRQIDVVEAEPFLVAMSQHHPHAGLPEVSLASLGDDEWLLPPGKPDGTHTALMEAFRDAGISPETPLGRQELSEFWPYVAAGRAVAIATPVSSPGPGVVLKPLAGRPIVGARVLRWNPQRVNEDEAQSCARAAIVTYLTQLTETAIPQLWWDSVPEHQPVLNAALLPVSTGGWDTD